MNGPQHYKLSETLLDSAREVESGSASERYYLDAAQVHATLALTAGLIDQRPRSSEWNEAIS